MLKGVSNNILVGNTFLCKRGVFNVRKRLTKSAVTKRFWTSKWLLSSRIYIYRLGKGETLNKLRGNVCINASSV